MQDDQIRKLMLDQKNVTLRQDEQERETELIKKQLEELQKENKKRIDIIRNECKLFVDIYPGSNGEMPNLDGIVNAKQHALKRLKEAFSEITIEDILWAGKSRSDDTISGTKESQRVECRLAHSFLRTQIIQNCRRRKIAGIKVKKPGYVRE